MEPALEQLVTADEEARARVSFAEKLAERNVAAARAERRRADENQKSAALKALEDELAAIRAAAEQEIATASQSHDAYLETLRAAGERQLDQAANVYASIVRGEP